MPRFLAFLLCTWLLAPLDTQAAIYRCVDASGKVSFQQQPCGGSEDQSMVTPRDQSTRPSSGIGASGGTDSRGRPKRAPLTSRAAASRGLANAPADAARPVSNAPPGCNLPWKTLAENIEVYAVNSVGSSQPAGFAIDQSGSEAQVIDLVVNSPGRPVALMLSFTTPTIWSVQWTPGTDIAAVWVSGGQRNVVAGVPQATPVLETVQGGNSPCGAFVWYADNFERADALATMAFGRPVAKKLRVAGNKFNIVLEGVNDKPRGPLVVGLPLAAGTKLRSAADNPPSRFLDPVGERIGIPGLNALVKAGALRPAKRADTTEWMTRWRATQDLPAIVDPLNEGLRGDAELASTYVVRRALVLPAGLQGGHSATFYVPAGTPVPDGDLGHSTLFDLNTLTCRGSSCPDEVRSVQRRAKDGDPALSADCRWPWASLSQAARVYAVAGGSGRPTGMKLDPKQDEAMVMDVIVNAPGEDTVLMLAASEPRIWNVRWTPGTRVVAVYASGPVAPVVRGLATETKLLVTSRAMQAPCPAFAVSRETLATLSPLAKLAFGKPVEQAYLGNTRGGPLALVRIGPALADGAALQGGATGDHRDVLVGGVVDPTTVALNDAIARRQLRRASVAEELEYGDAWRRAEKLPPAWQNAARDRGEAFYAYVVLAPFHLPEGIRASRNSGSRFIVPRGVAVPTGDRSAVVVMDWNTLPQ